MKMMVLVGQLPALVKPFVTIAAYHRLCEEKRYQVFHELYQITQTPATDKDKTSKIEQTLVTHGLYNHAKWALLFLPRVIRARVTSEHDDKVFPNGVSTMVAKHLLSDPQNEGASQGLV